MEKRRFIFLDLDGVINNSSSNFTKDSIETLGLATKISDLQNKHNCELPDGALQCLKTVDAVCVSLINLVIKDSPEDVILVMTSAQHSLFIKNGVLQQAFYIDYLKLIGLKFETVFLPRINQEDKAYGIEMAKNMLYEMGVLEEEDICVVIDDMAMNISKEYIFVQTSARYGFEFVNYVCATLEC